MTAQDHAPLSAAGWRMAMVVALAMFLAQMDEAVVVTALPQIARDFAVSPLALGLAVSAYMTAAVTVLPLSGWIAERFGIRRCFMAANLTFGAASLLCALAPSYWPFIAARAVQGAAGGMMVMVGRLILLRGTPRNQLVAAMNFATVPMLIAPTIGPTLGGLVVTYGAWPLVFLINLPIVALGAVGAVLFVPRITPAPRTPLDWVGALLAGAALALILAGLTSLGKPGQTGPGAALLAAGLATGGLAVRHLRRHPSPLVSLVPLSFQSFRTATISGGILLRMPLRAQAFILPLVMQVALGMDALRAGLLMMGLAGGDLLFKPFVVGVFRRLGQHGALVASGAAGVGACAVTILFSPGWPDWALVPVMLAIGMSRSVLFTGLSTLGIMSLPKDTMASANVLLNVSQQLVGALAVATTTLVVQLSAGHGHPQIGDFRLAATTLVGCGLIGLWAVSRARLDRG